MLMMVLALLEQQPSFFIFWCRWLKACRQRQCANALSTHTWRRRAIPLAVRHPASDLSRSLSLQPARGGLWSVCLLDLGGNGKCMQVRRGGI